MKVISPVYHKAKAQLRFNMMVNVIIVLGLFIALYLVSGDLEVRGF